MSRKAVATESNEKGVENLVPRLRFPEFRLHGAWEPTALGSVSSILKGKGISKADLDSSGSQPCIRYGELYTRYGETIRIVVSRTRVHSSELFLSKTNDVVIPSSGESKSDIAKASCVLVDGVALGGDLNVIRSRLDGTFLSYSLNGPVRLAIARVAQGDTVVHLYPRQLAALPIAVPIPAEQQKVAECLSSVDAVIAAQAKKVDALKTHKDGLMQQLFPREGETVPRLRFPEFLAAGDWGIRKISDILVKKSVRAILKDDAEYREIGIRSHGKGLFYKEPVTGKSVGDKAVFHVVPNALVLNIVFAWEQALAVTSDHDLGFIASHRFPMFVPRRNECDVAFMQRLLLTPIGKQLLKVASPGGAGRNRTLNQKDFEAAEVVLPLRSEQNRIASCLDNLDVLITAESRKLDALKRYKRGLMQQLFPSSLEGVE